jgi:tetratricopeptide (TPR) repeat protein
MQLEDWLRGLHDPGSLVVVDCGDRSDLFEITSERGSFIDHLRKFEGTVILVSRNARHGSLIARPHEICEVKELDLDSCVTLMCHNLEPYAHDASNEREMEEVVKSLSCIPRAIIQVTKVINSTQMTVSQFQEMYSTGEAFQLRLFGKIDGYSRPDHNLSVIGKGVFDLRSFRKMHAEPSRLLYQVYYLGGRSVPCALVATEDPLNKILLMLIVKAHYMIIEDESTQTFSIHPMVYLAMRKALGGERPLSDESDILEERKWYDEAVLAFSKHYPDANCESRAWWKDSFTHLISGYNLHSDTQRVAIATIYHRESSFFKRKGIFSEALKMASLAKSVLPEPIPSECLAILQDQVTLLDFLAKYREVHEILRGVTMEVGHPGNLWKKSMMARLEVADCANRYDSAIEIYRQVRTAGEASNADKLYLANATDDLSMALMQKGKYREAVMECRKALAERSTRLGSSHTDTLSSYHNLAEILYKDGKFEEALKYIQEALRGRDSALGPEHPETMYSKVMRARIQISKATMASEFDEAEAVLLHCIDRLGSKLSPSHPIVLTCKSEIARIMFSRGNYETAEQMNQSVLAAREQGPWLEPTTHPDTMTSRNQLSEVIRLKDGSKAADNLSERCLTERTVVLTNGSLTGDDFHPDQLASLHNRAIILSALGQHLAALQKIDLALLGRKCILGEYHPDYFLSMTWKGEIMRAQLHRYQSERTQTLDTIENLHKQAYEGLSWILGSEHQSSLQCATHMGLAKRERGSPASSEAEGLFRQIHCAYQHNMGDFHPETLKSKGRLAEAMRAASPRHHLEAKKLWRDSCGGLTKCYGFDAYVTANAYKGYEKFLRTYPDP